MNETDEYTERSELLFQIELYQRELVEAGFQERFGDYSSDVPTFVLRSHLTRLKRKLQELKLQATLRDMAMMTIHMFEYIYRNNEACRKLIDELLNRIFAVSKITRIILDYANIEN